MRVSYFMGVAVVDGSGSLEAVVAVAAVASVVLFFFNFFTDIHYRNGA